jgi:CIC family chloride channel protein
MDNPWPAPGGSRRRLSLDFFRARLASVDALPQLVLLAVVAGALTAMVSLAFRGAIEQIALRILPGGSSENFEGLPFDWRFGLPVVGAVLIGLALTFLRPADRRVGVTHVMERLGRHQGHMRLRNALTQFFGGIVALTTGASGGREGPAIHLGASTSSLLGQVFQLPNNSIRTLVGCGTAAAVACSFNTPIAGVILAVEVVLMEYTIASFIPVIVAAVTATLIMRFFYGSAPAFAVPPLAIESVFEIPYILLVGLACGLVAVAFIRCVGFFASLSKIPIGLRCALAGVITGLAGLVVPEVMGIGYDTVTAALSGDVALRTLVLLLIFKIVATSACVGLGLPVGLIGPSLLVGAVLGGLLGHGAAFVAPAFASSAGLYVMLGMCALMAAMLQAPLAALLAVLELTANPNVVLPAMLVIVVATMTASQLFHERSVFTAMLLRLGLTYEVNPATQHLQRAGVTSLMSRDFARLDEVADVEEVSAALASKPRWIVVESARGRLRCILNAADLRRFMGEAAEPRIGSIELLQVPGLRHDVTSIDFQATVHEALEKLKRTGAEALCVRRTTAPMIAPIVGVLTRGEVEDFARFE